MGTRPAPSPLWAPIWRARRRPVVTAGDAIGQPRGARHCLDCRRHGAGRHRQPHVSGAAQNGRCTERQAPTRDGGLPQSCQNPHIAVCCWKKDGIKSPRAWPHGAAPRCGAAAVLATVRAVYTYTCSIDSQLRMLHQGNKGDKADRKRAQHRATARSRAGAAPPSSWRRRWHRRPIDFDQPPPSAAAAGLVLLPCDAAAGARQRLCHHAGGACVQRGFCGEQPGAALWGWQEGAGGGRPMIPKDAPTT